MPFKVEVDRRIKLKTNKASCPGTRVIDDTADKFNYIKIWKRV